MDAAFEFAVNGLNMEFTINLVADGRSIPGGLFVDILTEKCQLIHKHIKSLKDCLLIVANVNNMVATIKLFDKNLEDSQLLHFTISNHCDLEDLLYRLWDRGARYTKGLYYRWPCCWTEKYRYLL